MQLNPAIDSRPSADPIGWRIAIALFAPLFAALNYLFAAFTDLRLASFAGAVQLSPTGWTRFSTPEWMFGSLLGPALAINPMFFFGVVLFSGVTMSMLIVRSIRVRRLVCGRRGWILITTIALWLLRIPLPGEWTLYYHVAVRY